MGRLCALLCLTLFVVDVRADLGFTTSFRSVSEADASVEVTVTRDTSEAAISVDWMTLPGTASAGSLSLSQFFSTFAQSTITTVGGITSTSITFNNVLYLFVGTETNGVIVYRFNVDAFQEVQRIPTGEVRGLAAFQMDNQLYLAAAVYRGPSPASFETNSLVLVLNAQSTFVQFQALATKGANAVKFFTTASDGSQYLAIANNQNNNRVSDVDSKIFKRVNGQFVAYQNIPTLGATDVEVVTVGSETLLAFANAFDSNSNSFQTPSTVWILDSTTGLFSLLQSIQTQGASSLQSFVLVTKTALAIANTRSDAGFTDVQSVLYVWSTEQKQFVRKQTFPTLGASSVAATTIDDASYLAFANSGNGLTQTYLTNSHIYKWDDLLGTFLLAAAVETNGARSVKRLLLPGDLNPSLLFINYGNLKTSPPEAVSSRIIKGAMALADADYISSSGRILFPAGVSTRTIVVGIVNDRLQENAENFSIRLSNPSLPQTITQSTITITIVDNDLAIFTTQDFALSVSENMPGGTPLSSSITIKNGIDPASVTFTLVNAPADQLQIGAKSGVLTTKVALDREAQAYILFTVRATLSSVPNLSDEASVRVSILDVNDNSPDFSQNSYYALLQEAAPKGTVITQVYASDPDEGLGGTVTYSFVQPQSNFAIDKATGVVTSLAMFDADNASMPLTFDVQLQAVDANSNNETPKVGFAILFVGLIDINDNTPTFSRDAYALSLPESAEKNTILLTVRATDADRTAVNRFILYDLAAGNEDGLFAIEPLTGRISLAGSLDFESKALFNLTVTATDAGQPPRVGRATFTVTVTNINDVTPSFPASQATAFTIKENSAPGTVVATVAAVDPDPAPQGTVYSLKCASQFCPFAIDAATAQITVTTALDFEVDPALYTLTITATDNELGKSASLNVKVEVLDLNDNSPVFQGQTPYSVDVTEGLAIGTLLLTLNASDSDGPLNNQITFRFEAAFSQGMDKFAIDAKTGAVTLIGDVDYEQAQMYTLRVVAADSGSPTLSKTTQLTVNVKDINDNSPTFVSEVRQVTISEDSSINTVVATVLATDADLSAVYNTISYDIVQRDDQTGASGKLTFAVDASSGSIRTISALDRESQSTYTLVIRASDSTREDTIKVTIVIRDVNDNAPIFKPVVCAPLPENAAPGFLLTLVEATDADEGVNAQLTFSFAQGCSDCAFFAVGVSNGAIMSKVSFDYEQRNTYVLTVVVTDMGTPRLSSSVDIPVAIADENDNKPVFTGAPYSFTIDEEIGGVVGTVVASDKDSDDFAKITFSLAPTGNDGSFTINPSTGEISANPGINLEVRGIPYSLVVLAEDGGGLAASADVVVNIRDINDNPPRFHAAAYSATIDEISEVGTIVNRVSASDDDFSAPNREFFFAITGGDANGQFAINASSGVISVAKKFVGPFGFLLEITAENIAQPRLSSSVFVNVTLNPANKVAPSFSSAVFSGVMVEKQNKVQTVARVFASDPDIGVNGEIAFSILNWGDKDFFSISTTKVAEGRWAGFFVGEITTRSFVSFDVVKSLSISVMARDFGVPSFNATVLVNIAIQDIDDNPPVFGSSAYRASLKENSLPKESILTVSATDADTGINAPITYYLLGTSDYSINKTSGELFVLKSFDFETDSQQQLITVVARSDNSSLVGSASVIISVLDENDNAPVFRPKANIQLSEDQPLVVGFDTILADDRDSGLNKELRFSISSGNTNGVFFIDPTTGTLSVVKMLDRETQDTYTLTVTVEDMGTPRLSASITFQVIITDVNDNAPVFSQNAYTFSVTEEQPAGQVAVPASPGAVIAATDRDLVGAGQVRFSFETPNPFFAIDEVTGALKTKVVIDRESISSFTFNVRASDTPATGTPLSTLVSITVAVDDVNDNAPDVLPTSARVSLAENNAVNAKILTLSASDKDAQATFAYSIQSVWPSSAASFVAIDQDGVLRAVKVFDREALSFVQLEVEVSDSLDPKIALSATVPVNITILDLNDNAPVLSSSTYSLSVVEEAGPMALASLGISATDADAGVNAQITFSLVAPVSLDGASINSATGVISIPSLDREVSGQHMLVVRAEDNGVPQNSATATVTITVLDINDNSPVFSAPSYGPFNIVEDAVPDLIVTIQATDKDQDSNGRVTFELLNFKDIFELNPTTGELRNKASLDREAAPEGYILSVKGVDGGGRFSTAQVLISVIDVNDNPPVFDLPAYNVAKDEQFSTDDVVVQVRATTLDIGSNAIITYAITSGDTQFFEIDASSGEIFATVSLDREEKDVYVIVVTASSSSATPLRTSVVVTLTLNDINDNAPIWVLNQPTKVTVEETKIGSIITLLATDRDLGANKAIAYSITKGNANNSFVVDAQSGVVGIASRLDYETRSQYILEISACDGGGLCTPRSLQVDLADVNDEPPVFKKDLGIRRIFEDATPGTIAARVQATDRDATLAFRTVTFDIVRGNEQGLFAIDPISGTVTTMASLDRETTPLVNLTVRARDQGVPQLEALVVVPITIEDINDNAPAVANPSLTLTISENMPAGLVVTNVIGVDADIGANALITYTITSGNTNAFFAINPITGVLTTTAPLDRELRDSYALTIMLIDGGFPAMYSTTVFQIRIQDENDNSPILDKESYMLQIDENLPLREVVLTAKATDADIGENKVISFRILESGLPFTIGQFSGDLSVAGVIDREVQSKYTFTIIAENPNNLLRSTRASVTIMINDLNDNVPMFRDAEYRARVQENILVSPLVTVSAWDADLDTNTRITYEIVSGNNWNLFAIDSETGVINNVAPLDYEKRTTHVLLVRANDGHQGPVALMSGNVTVTIEVADENDNGPVFEKESYSVSILETLAAGRDVITVKATDADSAPNAMVTFSLRGNLAGDFTIDANTGSISVAKSLNRENIASYSLQVIARDSGVPQNEMVVPLLITVLDVNDEAPKFSQSTLQGASLTFAESERVGSVLYTLTATDNDEPNSPNSQLVYTIIGGNADFFSLDASSGQLRLARPFDYESLRSLSARVQVMDRTTASGGADATLPDAFTIAIRVTDVNDNTPVFTRQVYTGQIRENVPERIPIVTVAAGDADEDGLQQVTFSLEASNSSAMFSIHPRTGVLTNIVELDREMSPACTFNVIATDSGGLTSVASIIVQVLDENDNIPRFLQKAYSWDIPEDSSVGKPVGRVAASDADESENSRISFSIVEDDALFAINEATGVITVNSPLDFETAKVHRFTVVASDNGRVKLSSVATVTFSILDVNDNSPVFDANTPSLVNIGELTQTGATILQVKATDADSGVNAEIAFGIAAPNNTPFLIDPQSGWVTLSGPLNRAAVSKYVLGITASNARANPALSSVVEVTVSIFDENDNNPVFGSGAYTFSVVENSSIGTQIGSVTATDADEGLNALLVYTLEGSTAFFTVDRSTGAVVIKASLDRETVPSHTFAITATDSGEALKRSSTVSVTVSILDANDNAPKFKDARMDVNSVVESDPVGTFVATLEASDADSLDAGKLRFSLADESAGAPFAVDAISGRVTVSGPLDREVQEKHALAFLVTDSAGQTDKAVVTVTLIDVNDNEPRFERSSVEAFVAENENNAILGVYAATDKDTGSFARVTYTLEVSPYSDFFSVGPTNGVLQTVRPLDYEAVKTISLAIRASDGGLPSLSSVLSVTVRVTPVNDDFPVFLTSVVESNLAENVLVGTPVLTVTATDDDEGDTLTYNLVGEEAFAINPFTGVISTNAPIDRETKASYSFSVVVTDAVNHKATTTVMISVLDENDNSPIFDAKEYTQNVIESLNRGATVAQVRATDADSGIFGTSGITYQILPGPNSNLFSIDATTGVIKTVSALDREVAVIIVLKVRATDGGARTTDAAVTINLIDVNDNPPAFTRSLYAFSVMENDAGVVSLIGKADAVDPDEGENAINNFSLSGNDAAPFTVDAEGNIRALAPLDREVKSMYSFTVRCSDPDRADFFSTATVRVIVGDVNDNDPIFSMSRYSLQVLENAAIGLELVQVIAADADAGANAEITFSISGITLLRDSTTSPGPLGLLSINSKTGSISVNGLLDREAVHVVTATVVATDGGKPTARWSTSAVEITLLDLNDNSPAFKDKQYAASVSEGAKVGDVILTLAASDPDSVGSKLRFTLLSGNVGGAFAIDANTGVVTLAAGLDRETLGSFSIVSRVFDQASQFDDVLVSITVTDVNDNAPFFKNAPSLTIRENLLRNDAILVEAWDTDADKNSQLKFRVLPGPNAGAFSVRQEGSWKAFLSIVGTLDRESLSSFILTVEVKDMGEPSLSATLAIPITLEDENDNAPQITTPNPLVASVRENALEGTVVTQVVATDADVGDNARFSFLVEDDNEFFWINPRTGVVQTLQRLDREARDFYTLTFSITDRGVPPMATFGTLNITVLDENDNAPATDRSFYEVSVREDVVVGQAFFAVVAKDLDINENAKLVYTLGAGNEKGFLAIDANSGTISAAKALDRELLDSILLSVKVSDSGASPLSKIIQVQVTITDANDNAPTFVKNAYSVSIFEDVRFTGVPLLQVSATDNDLPNSDNSKVLFRAQEEPLLFNVSSDGSIFVKRGAIFDREAQDVYQITVVAYDLGAPSLSSSVVVTIDILDRNDNAPLFAQLMYPITIEESAPAGQTVLTVVATDLDLGDNAAIAYSILEGNTNNAFSLNAKTGELKIVKIDFEAEKSYNILIEAMNAIATPVLSSRATILVTVTDVNDNSPIFGKPRYSVVVPEFTVPGTSIVSVMASDADSGENANVTYFLRPSDTALFQIDPFTGLITNLDELSREFATVHNIVAWATDNGSPRRRTAVNVTVTISDDNLNSPIFAASDYTFRISEYTTIGTVFGGVSATDADQGRNGRVRYEIVDGSNEFAVDLDGGFLSTMATSFDREALDAYTFTIRAFDNGVQPRFALATVNIIIDDENDNPPIFATMNPVVVFVSESTKTGTEIAEIQATDADIGANAEVRYRILAGNDLLHFSISEVTGKVYLGSVLDAEKELDFVLLVEAYNPDEVQVARTLLTVQVSDENDNTPILDSDQNFISVPEAAPVGQLLFTARASDADRSSPSRDFYFTISGSGFEKFSIDATSGELRLASALDRESVAVYNLTITVTDLGVPLLTSEGFLQVIVSDVNDNRPDFPPGGYFVEIPEDALVNSAVTYVEAADPDLNSVVAYSIKAGNSAEKFAIEASTGRIYLAQGVDREEKDSYTLTVAAEDADGLASLTQVYVTVTDVNDNFPIFSSDTYTASLLENSVNVLLVILRATDADLGQAGTRGLEYSIHPDELDAQSIFAVDGKSGHVTNRKAIDFEEVRELSFRVVVSDLGSPSLSTTCRVIVTILDVNDNAPVFTLATSTARVTENSPAGTAVITLTATDKDSGINALLSFSLDSAVADIFEVDNVTGVVTTKAPLDRERTALYNVRCIVEDGNGLMSSIFVSVIVDDVNDNKPVFPSETVEMVVLENLSPLTKIGRVSAVDADALANGHVTYTIAWTSSNTSSFRIDAETGDILYETGLLDRETLSSFKLLVVADDKSLPANPNQSPNRRRREAHVEQFSSESLRERRATCDGLPQSDCLSNPTCSWNGFSCSTFSCSGIFGEQSCNAAASKNCTYSKSTDGTFGVCHDTNSDPPCYLYSTQSSCVSQAHCDYDNFCFTKPKLVNPLPCSSYPMYSDCTAYFNCAWLGSENACGPATCKDKFMKTQCTVVNGRTCKWTSNSQFGTCHAADENPPCFVLQDEATCTSVSTCQWSGAICSDKPTTTVSTTIMGSTTALPSATTAAGGSGPGVTTATVPTTSSSSFSSSSSTTTTTTTTRSVTTPTTPTTPTTTTTSTTSTFTSPTTTTTTTATTTTATTTTTTTTTTTATTTTATTASTTTTTQVAFTDPGYKTLPNHPADYPCVGLCDSIVVTVILADVNDNSPVFGQASYTAVVSEDISIGSPITTVSTTDADIGKNAEIKYSISGSSSFAIDSNGVVRLAMQLDREVTDAYVLEITATDGGRPSLSTTVSLSVRVEDVNDNVPLFTSPSYDMSVEENSQAETIVGHIEASDRDLGANAAIKYAIVGGNEDQMFAVSEEGDVVLEGSIDREFKDVYVLTLEARDQGAPSLASTSTVTVRILDQNDNTPVFSQSVYTIVINENLDTVTPFVTVSAADADLGLFGNFGMVYELTSEYFRVDRTTGVVSGGVNPLDFELIQSLELTVTATDNSGAGRSTSAKIAVRVVDLNDNSPIFAAKTYAQSISEWTEEGTFVLVAEATDKDSGSFAKISYSLEGASNLFQIDSTNGTIVTSGKFDRESVAAYSFRVIATDGGGNTGSASVVITILDENDNTPVFTREKYTADISEAAVVGTEIIKVAATDADINENALLYFSLLNDTTLFTIDALSGAIKLNGGLDRELQDNYVFQVIVRDGGKVPRTSKVAVVSIRVLDENDHDPVFVESAKPSEKLSFSRSSGTPTYTYVNFVEEACPEPFEVCTLNKALFTVRATDEDINDVTFSIVGPAAGFAISKSGDVTLAQKLNREDQQDYSFTVQATDTGVPPRKVTANVRISLGDLNDNAPIFDKAIFSGATIPESFTAGAEVLTLVAADADIGSNSDLLYALVDSTGKVTDATANFAVNSRTGTITVVAVDYEQMTSHRLRVFVSDKGAVPRKTEANIVITITDVNDNTPVFATQPEVDVTLIISDAFTKGAPLAFLVATDKDATETNSKLRFDVTDVQPSRKWFTMAAHPISGTVSLEGEPRLLTASGFRYSTGAGAINSYTIEIEASNSEAQTPASARRTVKVEVKPFISTGVDKSIVTFNFEAPSPCEYFSDSPHCSGSAARRRRAISNSHNEIWSRRAFKCTDEDCYGKTIVPGLDGVCECLVHGPGVNGYDPTATSYTLRNIESGGSYQFQMRAVVDGVVASSSDYYSVVAPQYIPKDVVVKKLSSISYNVSWTAPRDPNGNVIGYQVCFCPTTTVPAALCTCSHPDAQGTSMTRKTYLPVPDEDQILQKGVGYTFVVELLTVLNTGREVIARSVPVSTAETVSADTTTKNSQGAVAGIVLAIIVVLLIAIILVLVYKRRKDKVGSTTLNKNQAADVEMGDLYQAAEQKQQRAGGHWDNYVTERQKQFWPGGAGESSDADAALPPVGLEEPEPVLSMREKRMSGMAVMPPSLEDQSGFNPKRSFGLNMPRVMADGFGGAFVPKSTSRTSPFAKTDSEVSVGANKIDESLARRFRGEVQSPTAIRAENLEATVSELKDKGGMDPEFARIKQEERNTPQSFLAATQTYNVKKNRYGNVLPIEGTRVHLQSTGVLGSDYINANYVDGWMRNHAYIASQAPLPQTMPDFWRMIWEQNSAVIVKATREVEMGKVKSHTYWPEEGETITVGDMEITTLSFMQVNEDYGIRRLTIQYQGETRDVAQFCLDSWPDQGVPNSAAGMVRLVLEVRRYVEAARAIRHSNGPLVVHCSAGIGRTGTYFAVDLVMHQLDSLGIVDIPTIVSVIRQQRAGSVQTAEQFKFLYDAALTYYRISPALHRLAAVSPDAFGRADHSSGYITIGEHEELGQMAETNVDMSDDPEYLIRALNQLC